MDDAGCRTILFLDPGTKLSCNLHHPGLFTALSMDQKMCWVMVMVQLLKASHAPQVSAVHPAPKRKHAEPPRVRGSKPVFFADPWLKTRFLLGAGYVFNRTRGKKHTFKNTFSCKKTFSFKTRLLLGAACSLKFRKFCTGDLGNKLGRS